MTTPNYHLLYVKNVAYSAQLYQQIFGQAPVELSDTFALFALESGVKIGLWSQATVVPVANPVGGSELAFALPDRTSVTQCLATWQTLPLSVIQAPQQMDFGYTFVMQDPDGHRLRVFCAEPA